MGERATGVLAESLVGCLVLNAWCAGNVGCVYVCVQCKVVSNDFHCLQCFFFFFFFFLDVSGCGCLLNLRLM